MVKLYVEGGGDAADLKSACRHGFTTFITHAGITKRPRVVACGSRRDAYDSYCTALSCGEDALLLVDSEDAVAPANAQGDPVSWQPWQHLKHRQGDGWDKPPRSQDADCHLMVQCMESWFVADRQTLKKFFGQGFKESQLPPASTPLEAIGKSRIYDALEEATRHCKTQPPYAKGAHSFKLLATIAPRKVLAASAWASRFIDLLKSRMGA